MGPMRAAFRFARRLAEGGILNGVARVQVELYGSLALTGMGHATDRAVLLGLAGHEPATIDPANIEKTIEQIRDTQILRIAGQRDVAFLETKDLLFHRNAMTPPGAQMQHPNGLRCTAYDSDGHVRRVH
jgi:L-serine dehydratase